MKTVILSLLVLLSVSTLAQKKAIQVHLTTGEILSSNYVMMYQATGFGQPYLKINSRKGDRIGIKQVSFVEGFDHNNTYKYYKPLDISGSLTWAERTFKSDRIELFYTNVSEFDWSVTYKNRFYRYIKDEGYSKRMKYSQLRADLADNPLSLEYLKKANKTRIAQTLLYVLGSALIITGSVQWLSDDELDPPGEASLDLPAAVFIGAATLYIPLIINGSKKNNFIKALQVYE
ncbi:MAG: hypothetical protein AAFX87_16915 [Bacteroidota bacterium]